MPIVETNYRIVQLRLKGVAPAVQKALNRDLRAYAKVVATAAKANASFSKKIPPTIGVTATAKFAGIRVKGQPGPLFERGSQGNPGEIRHPLFGNYDFWYSQPTHPFVAPAIHATESTALASMKRAVEKAGQLALGD